MFYLLKRVDEGQCNLGDRVMVLADFCGIKAGEKGTVVEIYDGGVMIEWDKGIETDSGFGKRPHDGFGREEFEYLGFETSKHPKIL